jgi:glycolate oxidase FAD binding subunit
MQTDAAIDRSLQPETVEGLREVLLGTEGPVLVCGAGRHLSFGNPGGPFAATISTRRLNRILHYEPADLTIAVEAGATVAEVNRTLAEHHQILPIDTPFPEVTTIGGLFATGLGGPRRNRYLSLRDWTLGVEVMAPDGVVTKSGGMVVKNVTGFDLPRLHHGAHGAFGIVTRVNLKVVPREESSRSIVVRYASAADAHAAALAVLGSQLEPASVVVAWNNDWTLAVTCDGPLSSIDWQANAILELATSIAEPGDSQVSEGSAGGLASFLTVMNLSSDRAVARLSVPASGQLECLEQLSRITGNQAVADPGAGLIYTSGIPSLEWRTAMQHISPNVTFLSLPDDLKDGIDVFGPLDPISARLIRNLKQEFDPTGKLNRGRFVLGI